MIAPAQCEHGKLALQQALACKGNLIHSALDIRTSWRHANSHILSLDLQGTVDNAVAFEPKLGRGPA